MSDSTDTRDPALTQRQRTILDVIRSSVTTRGYPPSIREIGDAVGLTSTSSVAHQLRTLERKGYLRRDPNRPRAVDVRTPEELAGPVVATDVAGSDALPEPTYVPVLGRIAAGGPDGATYFFFGDEQGGVAMTFVDHKSRGPPRGGRTRWPLDPLARLGATSR